MKKVGIEPSTAAKQSFFQQCRPQQRALFSFSIIAMSKQGLILVLTDCCTDIFLVFLLFGPQQTGSYLHAFLNTYFICLGGGSISIPEVLTDSGWYPIGPPIPTMFYVSCMVALDDASILVSGGETSQGRYSAKTYIFTPGNGSWTDGITLNWSFNYGIVYGSGRLMNNLERVLR